MVPRAWLCLNRARPKPRSAWSGLHAFHWAVALIPFFICSLAGLVLAHEVHHEVSREVRAWLELNHRIGGVIVLILAGLTWLELLEVRPASVVKLTWPSCLLLIGGYNLIWSDKLAWPIGPSSLANSLANPEVLQHKMLAVAVLTLGLIDLLRRQNWVAHPAWLFLFYGMAALTGGLLLMHDSGAAPNRHVPGLTTSHVLMGVLALLALVFKVLVDYRLILGKAAHLYPLLLAALGVQLLLFTKSSGMGG